MTASACEYLYAADEHANMADTYTGADLLVDALDAYGVEYVFGNPGTTELPILDAIADSTLEYVLGLQEDIATGMAAGYASARRHQPGVEHPLGVANLHVTPGLAHGLGNIFAAMYAGAPVLVTAGNHERDFRHEEPILTGDLEALAEQFCKETAEVTDIDALPMLLRRAVRRALTPPTGPVFLALPSDVMREPTDADPERLGAIPDAGGGDSEQIAAAAAAFETAEQPVMVVGDHVARAGRVATEAAVDLAEATGARVHGEILGGEVSFPTDHRQFASVISPDETAAREAMDADVLALIGCSTNTTLMRHEESLVPEDATIVQLSSAPREVGKNHPADIAVIGDPGRIMQQITDRVAQQIDDTTRRRRIEAIGATTPDPLEDAEALTKARLVEAMHDVAPEAFVIDESITAREPLLERMPFEPGQYLWNTGGGLGYGLPAAVGAAMAEAERTDPRPVVGFIGDGSYLYYPHAIYTAAAEGADLTVVIPDNRSYQILKDNTVAMLGGDYDAYDFVGMDFEPPVDLPTNAESHGARGHRVTSIDAFEETFATAIDRSGPDVIDVILEE